MPSAVITGGSAGLGNALASALAAAGWDLVITGRRADLLAAAARKLSPAGRVTTVTGDVADATHRRDLVGNTGRSTCW
jgi:NADP-dependent 3-hydroxy acid dehydrogenase YdfG